MKYLLICTIILSFNSFSNDEELEGYTFQANFESKESDRTVAKQKVDFKKTDSKDTVASDDTKRVQPDYWQWTEKVE